LRSLTDAAEKHYLGANLVGGKSNSDTYLVLNESAASYVGDSIEAVLSLILSCKSVSRGFDLSRRPLKEEIRQRFVDFRFRDYAHFMIKDVFGVAQGVSIATSIDPDLRTYLDTNILEGIRDRAVGMARASLDLSCKVGQ
jgi:hypothetical protein